MGRIKNYVALSLLMVISFGCEKETIDLPVEDAKASEDLTFLEFVNSGMDMENYFRKGQEKSALTKSQQSDLINTDEAYFENSCYNLPVEDFEEARIPEGSGGLVAAPLWEGSPSGKFQPGEILPGLIITTEEFNPELTVYGDAFRDNDTKLITSRRDQSLILQFTGDDVLTVGLDISSYPYPNMESTGKVTVKAYNGEGDLIYDEVIETLTSGTFWTISDSGSISEIRLSSTNNDAWVGIDNIAFGTCQVPDADFDGCSDDLDDNDASNLEVFITIGDCNSGVANRMTSKCGIFLADDVDSFEDGTYRNHGALVKEFASLTNLWVSEGLISSEEKDLLMSCAAKAGLE